MEGKKIFLTGFMGCGKSSHGKKLAKALATSFIDLDNYIEKKEGMSIDEIFTKSGEDAFREKETMYLNQVIARYANAVIALGGGTPCFNDNIKTILKNGTLIYIQMVPEALFNRIENAVIPRPLLKGKTPEESLEFIKALLKKRESYYNQAHITVNGIDLTTAKLQQSLSEYLVKS